MSDFFTLENSKLSQEEKNIYSNKQWRWFQDTNNGVYNNQINFDLTGLYNAEGYTNPREMRLEIPLILVASAPNVETATAVGGAAAVYSDYIYSDLDNTVCLKNGYYNIIDSVILNYDNNVMQQATNNLNFYVSFDMVSKLSQADLRTIGHKIGFYPDDSEGWDIFNTDADGSLAGQGVLNNNRVSNHALDERSCVYNHKPTAGKYAKIIDSNKYSQTFASYTTPKTQVNAVGATGYSYQAWHITATIRLRDVCSFFDKMCLTKGFYALLTFNLNLGNCVLTRANHTNADNNKLTLKSSNFRYNTCPFMITSDFTTKFRRVDAANAGPSTDITVGLHIGKVGGAQSVLGDNIKHAMPTCRLYAPLIKLSPTVALSYAELNKTKYIEFDEILAVQKPNNAMNDAFNITISNSIVNPVALLVVPILSASNANFGGVMQSLSPFDSCPATTMPLAQISNFNVQLGGQNIYNENVLFTYEMFENELSLHNKINGGQTYGLTSGLISYKDFINNYCYLYVDLSRRTSESKEPKSIVVVGRNDSKNTFDMHIYVVRKRSVEINTETGRVVESTLTA